jgi:hypothetical protein
LQASGKIDLAAFRIAWGREGDNEYGGRDQGFSHRSLA